MLNAHRHSETFFGESRSPIRCSRF